MASLRTAAMRACRSPLVSAAPRPAAPRPAARPAVFSAAAAAARRGIATSETRKKSEIIREKEVPVSMYTPDAKGVASANATGDRFTIPVARNNAEIADENGPVTPLGRGVYENLPKTMKSMSVMGKVIIVTG